MVLKRATLAALAAAVLSSAAILVACGGDKGEVKLTSEQQKETAARLAPEGEVALAGAVAAPAAGGAARTGEEIVNTKCNVCHASGAGGAPKVGSVDDWAPRVAKGVDVLYGSVVNGFQGMPPKGLCMDCSPEEIHAAVDHMLEKSK